VTRLLPKTIMPLEGTFLASATELARRIRARELSSREVVEAHVARAREVNPSINAIVAERYEDALGEADAADAALAAGVPLGPLHGVPFTVKEAFAVTGMPHCAGLVARREHRATEDATAVARLRKAGAIVLGVTNTSELCMWVESSNRVYGRSKNPYDPTRIVGGSSGGEAAAVGSGASPFGVGSDVGGSIRNPAFFNGVFGHKPTGGLVPNTGQFPSAESGYLTTGPLCRRAEDLMPLLALMSGPDGRDGVCRTMTLGDPAEVDLGRLRVLNVRGNGFLSVSPALKEAQEKVARHLERRGARVERRRFPRLRRSIEIWSAMLADMGGTPFGVMLGNGKAVNLSAQLPLWLLGRSPHTLPALGLALIERFARQSPRQLARFVAEGAALRDELVEALGPGGVMLYPVYPETAPKHGWPLLPPIRWAYPAILNVMEIPATAVPLGLDAQGLPLGIQVAAAHGNDQLTIAVAQELEPPRGRSPSGNGRPTR
jgi:fatty acid amide hydrolase 2